MSSATQTYTLDELVGKTQEPTHIGIVGQRWALCGRDCADAFESRVLRSGEAVCGRCAKLCIEEYGGLP